MAAPKKKTEEEVPEPTEAELKREAELEEEELLADMPKLKAPDKLRIGERNRLMKLAIAQRSVFKNTLGDKKTSKDVDTDDIDEDELVAVLDLMDGVDKFAESIAFDPEEYAEWAEGKEFDTFSALLNRYSVALGK